LRFQICKQNKIQTHNPEVRGSPPFVGTGESSPRYLTISRHLQGACFLLDYGIGLVLVNRWTAQATFFAVEHEYDIAILAPGEKLTARRA
jgi:hypothetical protein